MNNLTSAAVELIPQQEAATQAALLRWMLVEQDRLVTIVAAGCSGQEAKALMTREDA